MLDQIVEDNDPLFYSRLFFEVAARLPRYTDCLNNKGGSYHTLLNRLSWLTIAKNLLELSENKVSPYRMNVWNDLNRLNKKHESNLKVISQQKRDEAYPIYSSMQLKTLDLKKLFIREVFDYYCGLEAFGFDYTDTMGCLDDFSNVIHALVAQEKLYLAAKNKLKEIVSVASDNRCVNNRFYAQLLRELVKFYIDPSNEARFLSYTSLPQASIYKECARLLEHAMRFAKNTDTGDKTFCNMIEKINLLNTYLVQKIKQPMPALSNGEFFKAPEAIKSFQNIVEEHLDFMYQSRKCGVATETICNYTLKFITIQYEGFSTELRQFAANSALVLNTHCF